MIYYGIFCVATALTTMIRIQIPASKMAFRKEPLSFWFFIFGVDMAAAPILFLPLLFSHKVMLANTVIAFLDRHGK
jgi:hypothetical protein